MSDDALQESRVVFDGRLLDVRVDRVRLPDGTLVDREIVRHPGAAAVLPALSPNRAGKGTGPEVVLLRQYRYAAGGRLWEIPAGTLEPGEEPEACARRELIEEAGLEAGDLVAMGSVYTTPGFTDERIHLFLARDPEESRARPEDGELLERRVLRLRSALEMVRSGEIRDAKTALSLLHAARFEGLEG